MTEVVLHVGQPKAASTSIQTALRDNQQLLAGAGISYPVLTRKEHGPQVIDLMLRFQDDGRRYPNFSRLHHPGGWDQLCQQIRDADRAIVSAEILSLCGPELARRVVRDLCDDEPPSIVLCVRRPSVALVSTYSQVARVQPTLGCESWVRVSLQSALLHDDRSVVNLHNPLLIQTWSEFGSVECVDVDDRLPEELDRDVIRALGLEGVVHTPFLSRRNASPSAARLVAWQRLQSRRPDPAVLKAATLPTDALARSLPSAGGKFRLTDDVADLVDRSFPTDRETPETDEARARLGERLADPTAMTSVGMDERTFAQAVSMCLADFVARTQ